MDPIKLALVGAGRRAWDVYLEILPGPSMTLGGRVHTNGNLYVGCGSTLTMNTNRSVTATFDEIANTPPTIKARINIDVTA